MATNNHAIQTPEPRVTLHILRGRAAKKSRVMTGPTLLIGADGQCDVQMRSVDVAPKHCLVSRRDGRVVATRLNADYALLRNGLPLSEEELQDGDTLTLGPFALQFTIETESAAAERTDDRAAAEPIVAKPAAPPPAVKPSPAKPTAAKPTFPLLRRRAEIKAAEAAERTAAVRPPEQTTLPLSVPEPIAAPPPVAESAGAREDLAKEQKRIEEGRAELQAGYLDHQTREREIGEREEKLRLWEEQLSKTEAFVGRQHEDFADQLAVLEQRRRVLEERRSRLIRFRQQQLQRGRRRRGALALLLANLDERGADLRRRDEDFNQQVARWRETAAALDLRREEVERKSRETAERLTEVQRRQDELIAERTRLQNESHALLVRSKEYESQRAALDARAEALKADENDLEMVRREVARERERLQERDQEIDRLNAATEARADAVRGREDQVAEGEAANKNQRMQLDAQAAELGERAKKLHAQIEAQRNAIDLQRAAVEANAGRHEALKVDFTRQQSEWREQTETLRREREQLARQASLLAAREREINLLDVQGGIDRDALTAQREELRGQQNRLVAIAAEAERAERALRLESHRLATTAQELEQRQQKILEQERSLAGLVERRGAALESQAIALQAERAALEQEAVVQRRQAGRLKTVGFRFAQRRKAAVERFSEMEQRFAACQSELAALGESQHRLQATLADYLHRMRERERNALAWLHSVRAESGALAAAHADLGEQIRAAAGSSTNAEALARSLGAWSARLVRLQQSLVEGEAVIAAPLVKAPAAVGEPAARIDRVVEPIKTSAVAPALQPKSAVPADASEADAVAVLEVAPPSAPPAWLFRLSAAGLADEEVLRFMAAASRRRGVTLEQGLVDDGIVTRFQVERAQADRVDELVIGPARIFDLIHQGRVTTTYRVMLPNFDRPMALRLLNLRLGRSEEMRAAYESTVRPLIGLRHTNIVAMHEFFAARDRFGVVLDVAPGRPLTELAKKGVQPAMLVGCCRQATAALLAAQRAGFVHHNLRPSRLLVTTAGRVVLLGYGEPSWLTRLHRCEMGREWEYYVAPEEQTGERPIDARADLFSVGRIFLEAAAGRRILPGETVSLPAGFPRGFDGLLTRLTEPDPDRRCRSAGEVLEILDAMIDENPAQATPRAAAAA